MPNNFSHNRIKICGITRIEDVQAVVQSGANALGLVFYSKSPRAVSIEQAVAILQSLPPFITSVGLFVNASTDDVKHIINNTKLDLLQFHGEETPDYCAQFSRPYIKALRMSPDLDLEQSIQAYTTAQGILLDTYQAGVPGGTGEVFDWERIPAHLARSIILAGGLTPDNVAQAIQQVHPYAVDVSGGVEASKGIKDAQKIHAFVQAVRNA